MFGFDKDTDYSQNLMDPDRPEGKAMLRKGILMIIGVFVLLLIVMLLEIFGVISKTISLVIMLPIGLYIVMTYLRVRGDDLFD